MVTAPEPTDVDLVFPVDIAVVREFGVAVLFFVDVSMVGVMHLQIPS